MNKRKIVSKIFTSVVTTAFVLGVGAVTPNLGTTKDGRVSISGGFKVYADANICKNTTKYISGGSDSFAIKSDGSLWATGANWLGQLGDGTKTNRSCWEKVGSGFSKVSSSFYHSLAIKSDGTLWDTGANWLGQLGDGTTVSKSSWKKVGSGFSDVACSSSHSLALKKDGTLWVCGWNMYGQLGDGTKTNKSTWEKVGSGFCQIACNDRESLALKEDGTLWGCGENQFGELGDGTTVSELSWKQVGSGFTKIAGGNTHSLALKADGTLWATGYNSWGELGDGTKTMRTSWEQVGSGFSDIACGNMHSLALKSDGTLWAAGNNGTAGSDESKTSWEKVGSGFSQIACGGFHSLAVKTDGTLWVTGDNTYGQLGDGTTTESNMFKQVLTGIANNNEDKAAPQITLSQNTDSWTNSQVTINISASDAETGVDKIQTPDGKWVTSDSTTYNVTANGTYTFKAVDKAGNETSKSITIKNIDTIAPSAPSINLDKNKLTITGGSDSESGVKETDYQLNNGAWIKYTAPVTLDDGKYTINVKTIDNAGNSSVIATTKANINKDPIVNASKISLDNILAYISIGQTNTLTASIMPSNTSNKNVKWTSSDSSVASVDQNGKVTAIKAGRAIITASTQDGTNLSDSCIILVLNDQTVTLKLTFVDNTSKNYKISPDEFNNFFVWYCDEVGGKINQPVYVLNVQDNESSKVEKTCILFSRILSVQTI